MKLAPPIVPTRCAHWGWDEHRYFGTPVFAGLLGRESFTGLTALSVLGRRLDGEQCGIVDDMAAAFTMADPRIWPLKLTRCIAAYGHMVPAAAAGLSIQQGAQIGPWATQGAAEDLAHFRVEIQGRYEDREHVRALVQARLRHQPALWGFGTPFRSKDERLVAFSAAIRRRGRDALPHWRTLDAVASALGEMRGVAPNISLGIAAAALDMGLAVEETGPLATSLMQHMFFSNAREGAEQAPEVLRQVPSAYVSYVGVAPRVSPRAKRDAQSLK